MENYEFESIFLITLYFENRKMRASFKYAKHKSTHPRSRNVCHGVIISHTGILLLH